ncbi:MAG: hypothetical protein JWR78_4107 [Mycobacterium sp.]|nr:hypothetical protein [Mycobacterium sp.]
MMPSTASANNEPVLTSGARIRFIGHMYLTCTDFGGQTRDRTATFRFSGGYACDSKPFALVTALQIGRIGPLRAPVLKVWPYFGPMEREVFDLPSGGRHAPTENIDQTEPGHL